MNPPVLKRRRVRKGTKSCWECRNRKIKCLYRDPDDPVCINCKEHDTECLSQQFSADPATSEAANGLESTVDGFVNQALTQRLAQMESLLRDLLRAQQPASQEVYRGPTLIHPVESTVDLLDSSAVTHAQAIAAAVSCPDVVPKPNRPDGSTSELLNGTGINTIVPINATPPESIVNNCYLIAQQDGWRRRCEQLSQDLFALLPGAGLRHMLAHESAGSSAVLSLFQSLEDQIAGRTEAAWSLASATWPTIDTHPVLIARRLIQYAICMQQLPPNFDLTRLKMPNNQQPCEVLGTWVGAATSLLAGNDELVGCIEGVEALMLLGLFQSDAGHLRKAWVTTRRALTLSQLMGMSRSTSLPIRSCASSKDPQIVPSLALLWEAIVSTDYYQSLILGLPIGSCSGFSRSVPPKTPVEELNRIHAVVSRRIIDRNEIAVGNELHELTRAIENDLSCAADNLSGEWWEIPDIPGAVKQSSSSGGLARLFTACSTLNMQIKHFTLVIFLHLPFLLRKDRRHESSQFQSMDASRSVLNRFLAYRGEYVWHVSGRQVDYSALISAITLCLGHLVIIPSTKRQDDRQLVEKTILKFRELAGYKRDRLSSESAETLHQLLPILTAESHGPARINIPFLGTVKIGPQATADTVDPPTRTEDNMQVQSILSLLANQDYFSDMGMFELSGTDTDMTQLEDWSFQDTNTAHWESSAQNL